MLNYLRNIIIRKQSKARQFFISKNRKFNSGKFSRFNLEYKNYGKKNTNKFFYVIRRTPGAGFFSNLNFVIHNLLICEKLKMIPVIDMENYTTIYNCKNKINGTLNAWLYYFEPVSKFSLSEVYESKNVIICDNKTSSKGTFEKNTFTSEFKYFHGFRYLNSKHKKIIKKYIHIKKDILTEANRFAQKNFKNKKILGVCFRGSDQKKSAYQPYTPTEEQMYNATNILLKKYKFNKIYICTEDLDYLNFYKKNFGDKLLYYNCPRTKYKRDLFDYPSKKHRYYLGKGNLIDMLNLAKTSYLLFTTSNIPEAAMFFADKKIPHSIIDNGMKGNIFTSQFSFILKKNFPEFLGGFKKNPLE